MPGGGGLVRTGGHWDTSPSCWPVSSDRTGSVVRKPLRIAVFGCCGLLLLAGLVVIGLFMASRYVPGAYQEALAADPEILASESHEMVRQAAALHNQVREKKGPWSARFTARRINAWLAVDMEKNHRDLLPQGVSEPRVAIDPEAVTLFCRYRRGKITSVLSLAVDVYLVETDVVAMRIRSAQAGLLPLPLEEILGQITRQARRRQINLQWKQAEGDPVALFRLLLRDEKSGRQVRIESIKLGKGEIVVSGRTD